MADCGARHLVLMGRNPPSQAAARAIDAMRRAGAEVVVVGADVAEAAEVESVAERIQRTMPRLKGIVHAAGVLENGPVVDLDADRLSRVMAPKVAGAWNLHEATRGEDLDFFLLFSSAVSVLGSPGQGSYAAANSFLDALAHYRRAEGLPALSINWGPWADVGLVAHGHFAGAQDRAGHPGVKGIAPRRGLEVLGSLLGSDLPQVTVLPFDLRTLLDLFPSAARIPLFAEVGGKDSHVSRFYARPAIRQEYLAPRNDIERRLAELWRQTLRVDSVGVRDSFFELGGDSVLAAQIVTSAQRAFGVELDLREAFRSLTIERLAQQVEMTLIARLDALSESDVEELLLDEKTRSGSEG
jgi:acyl carrier protein